MVEFKITETWLDEHNVDIDLFYEALENAGFDVDPAGIGDDGAFWVFEASDDNQDGIPDFIAGLITDPITTNPSQGGAIGG